MRISGLTLLVALAWLLPAGQSVADPAADGQAQLVFSNGGRIVRMNADGTERTVLTRKKGLRGGPVKGSLLQVAANRRSDVAPRVSPDGSRTLFSRTGEFGDDLTMDLAKTMILHLEGGNAREILKRRKGVSFSNADWLPDGSDLVATRMKQGGRRIERSIVIVKPNGDVVRTVLQLRPHLRKKNGRWPNSPMKIPAELAVSPDGTTLLATIRNTGSGAIGRLERIDLESGRRKVIARRAGQGAWSPDGASIVFVSKRDRNGCIEDDVGGCRPAGELYTASADGSAVIRVTRSRADESSPSWAPDGQQIAYASSRNMPRSPAAREIYSMAPDGTCPTWLTNGSPASIEPEWSGSAGDRSDPGSCDPVDRPALSEVEPRYPNLKMARPRLWLGPEFEGRLLSDTVELVFMSVDLYGDCAWFEASRCRKPLSVHTLPVCFAEDEYLGMLSGLVMAKVRRERGATVVGDRGGNAGLLFSGGAITWVVADRNGLPVLTRLSSRAVKELRPFGASGPGRLPAARIPGPVVKKMLTAERAVRKAGSRRRAARRLKLSRGAVAERLQALRGARKLGPLRRLKCNPRVVNDPWGLDGALSSAGSGRAAQPAVSSSGSDQAARSALLRELRALLP